MTKKWIVQAKKEDIPSLDIDHITDLLLENRGITTPKDKKAFLHPLLEEVTIDSVGIDRKQLSKCLKRLRKAIEEKTKIIIFGDYDVDGVTGSAILWETLHKFGGDCLPYIPSRFDEGYGLSVKGIDNLLRSQPDTKLIVTVDNGIVANEAVKYAHSKGIEVIITDHHVAEEDLPKAYAIVHTTKLCGAGVAYLLTRELAQEMGEEIIEGHLELATLGTVADLVPLVGANRTIVKFGLTSLAKTQRVGLRALYQEAVIETSSLDTYHIGHVIAPRLNAAGRLESAMDSLRLLCTLDPTRAFKLASLLGATNKERQNIMLEATMHASEQVRKQADLQKLLFIGDGSYPEGVIGLVAGRLVEEFYRPAIVLSLKESYAKASVRSISGFNIIDFLRQFSEEFINVGGHPMAAGFTIERKRFEVLKNKLEQRAQEVLTDEILTKTLKIDCEIPLTSITPELCLALKKLAPFGMGNPEPVFMSCGVEVLESKIIGRDGKHAKFLLADNDGNRFEAIAFNMAEMARKIKLGERIDIAYVIEENEWNGRKKLQLKLRDLRFT